MKYFFTFVVFWLQKMGLQCAEIFVLGVIVCAHKIVSELQSCVSQDCVWMLLWHNVCSHIYFSISALW